MNSTQKSLFIASIAVFSLAIASMSSCSNNPEGAYSTEEKLEQDSSDSTAQEQGFEELMMQDSLTKDSQ